MSKQKAGFFLIPLPLYRMHVLVTWGTSGDEIAKYMKTKGVKATPRFEGDFKEATNGALGLCMKFDNEYPDLLVWLAKQPKDLNSFHTLYHELFHAVDGISESRNLGDEPEARAYLFEYLVKVCDETFGRR